MDNYWPDGSSGGNPRYIVLLDPSRSLFNRAARLLGPLVPQVI